VGFSDQWLKADALASLEQDLERDGILELLRIG